MGKKVLIIFLFVFICACDQKEDDYSGLSKLIAKRHQARMSSPEKNSTDPAGKAEPGQSAEKSGKYKKKELKSTPLYKKKIQIVDSASGTLIANGVAYLNKDGGIVKITVIKK